LSPRLHSVRERIQHDFGVIVPLASGVEQPLIDLAVLGHNAAAASPPVVYTVPGCHVDSSGVFALDGSIVVLDVAIDRPDVSIEFTVGNKRCGTVCGPWAKGHIADLSAIYGDMLRERRDQEASKLLQELKDFTVRGLWRPLIVPCRVYLQAHARLLRNAPEGFAQIHLHTVITRHIQ
jgi:hypothetical protein